MKKYVRIIAAAIFAVIMVLGAAACGSSEREAITEAKEMSPDDFKAACETLEYKSLVKKPDDNVDKKIKVEVRVEQDLDGYYQAYSGKLSDQPDSWYDNEFVLAPVSEDVDLSEGDAVTVYGIYNGLTEVERALSGDSDKVPEIAVLAVGKPETQVAVRKMFKSIKLKKSTDEWGDTEYTAVVENTTSVKFGSFSIEAEMLDKDGTVIGNDSAYAENWKPGQKTTFKFTYPPEGTAKCKLTEFNYYSY